MLAPPVGPRRRTTDLLASLVTDFFELICRAIRGISTRSHVWVFFSRPWESALPCRIGARTQQHRWPKPAEFPCPGPHEEVAMDHCHHRHEQLSSRFCRSHRSRAETRRRSRRRMTRPSWNRPTSRIAQRGVREIADGKRAGRDRNWRSLMAPDCRGGVVSVLRRLIGGRR